MERVAAVKAGPLMRVPTVKTLRATFRNLSSHEANLIRKLAKATKDTLPVLLEKHCPITDANVRRCYGERFTSHMRRTEIKLQAIDEVLGTCGVEALGDLPDDSTSPAPYAYCNTGDSYAATLVYKHATDNLFISSWGDIAERLS
jgi:hypothetical protein